MPLSRRQFLMDAAAAGAVAVMPRAVRAAPGFKVGVTDWNLRQTMKVEALALAQSLGFRRRAGEHRTRRGRAAHGAAAQ